MSILLPRFFRSAFRHDPIASFLMTMGAVDVSLGGLSGHGGLLILGVVVFGGALGLKWSQSQRRTQEFVEQTVQQHYLPSESSQSELPMLLINKKRPPS